MNEATEPDYQKNPETGYSLYSTSKFQFNIPKFFEAEINYDVDDSDNSTSQLGSIDVTNLRKNPDYAIYYHNWWISDKIIRLLPFLTYIGDRMGLTLLGLGRDSKFNFEASCLLTGGSKNA
jgi:hypothetical protein